jgi:nucleotide-binding universal stress UspA family protein
MAIEKILFTTEFKPYALNSLETMIPLKKAGLREILLFHVISRDEVGFVPFGGYMKEEEERLHEKARIRLEDWQNTLSEKGLDSRVIVKVGNPVHEIIHTAEEEKVDLIVVGKKEKSLVETPFGSSRTMEIVTRSHVPVFIRKYIVNFKIDSDILTRTNDRPFPTPMLVTDWSDPSQRALDLLISLAGVVKKGLIFHNVDIKELRKDESEKPHDIEDQYRARMEEYCKRLERHGIACESHLGAGDIVDEIIRVSRERKASMIVMGTTGKGRFHEIFQGSPSHQIARLSELPTLLVP